MNRKQYEKFYKQFQKWAVRVEKNGIQKNGTEISIFRDNSNPFGCFTKSWWKIILYNITHRNKIDWLDYEDILKYLIVNLTIKGVYLWNFGCHENHKKQTHTCWLLRKDLLNALGSPRNGKVIKHAFVKMLLTLWD
jgi:hypothetical protein